MGKLKEDVKIAWIDALLSGDYPQTKYLLHTPDGYCCLGVLCDLAVQAGVIGRPKYREFSEPSGSYYRYGDAELGADYPPRAVMEWAAEEPWDRYARELARMNDFGKSFAEIAEFIRGNL